MKTIKHSPFLAKVIQHVNQSDRLGKRLVVFPTELSIDYFRTLLDKEKWQDGTTCLTLHQLMLTHSSLKLLPTVALLSRLHRLAEQILNRKESFEQFFSWGITLLEDFNSIDTHLVNSSQLFASLIQQKQLPSDAFVAQNSLEYLEKARSLFLLQQKEALLFWKQLPLLYQSFREKLIATGEGYAGLCYKMAQLSPEIMATYRELIFVGFNRLTPVQERFIRECCSLVLTTFFWDIDTHYLDNEINLAGHYLRQHRAKKWFEKSFPKVTYLNDPHKRVFLIEASSIVAQVQAVVTALQAKTDDSKPKFLPGQTAIVVSGSELLIPLLDHLAQLSIPLHCRLDYPFNATVIYTLVERLIALWEVSTVSQEQQQTSIQIVDLLGFCHPFVEEVVQSEMMAMRASLAQGGREGILYYQESIFNPCLNKSAKNLLGYLKGVFTYIGSHFIKSDHLFLELHKKSLYHLLAHIEALLEEITTCSISFFLNGLKESRVVFRKDNPVTGLYIVDVAQSYNLDFEHLFFIGMNEGHFPRPRQDDSFLPYDLRYSFGLPFVDKVAENNTAYGFYRLLQRAQNIYCYYAQKNSLDASSEMSQYLLQLKFDSKLKIIESHRSINLLERSIAAISIQKDHAVMELLNRFWTKEGVAASSLTPSALMAYLACPLQFYFIYLLQLKQTVLPKDAAEAIQLGILFHRVMASLYQPFVGREVDKAILTSLKSKITIKVKEAIALQKSELSTPILLHALLEKLLARMLDLDDADAPFTLLGVEVAIKQPIVLDVDIPRKVLLGGVIDRIDRKNHSIRIVDYKTGWANGKISNIATLFDPTKVKQNKAIFQLVFYAWLFYSLHGCDDQQSIMPYLIHVREFFLEDYRPGISIQQPGDGKKYQRIEDMRAYAEPFEEGLKGLLTEIFNPAIPFSQTEDLEICTYCPYVRICQRD